jgi:hypothetical protein
MVLSVETTARDGIELPLNGSVSTGISVLSVTVNSINLW